MDSVQTKVAVCDIRKIEKSRIFIFFDYTAPYEEFFSPSILFPVKIWSRKKYGKIQSMEKYNLLLNINIS